MNLEETIQKIDELRGKLDKVKLSTNDLLRLIPHFRLDWGNEAIDLAEEYNIGATKPILLSGLAENEHKIKLNSLLFTNNKIASTLVQTFMVNKELTFNKLLEIHGLIFKNGGVIRDIDVTVNDDRKQQITPFAIHQEIETQLKELLIWFNDEIKNSKEHPLFIGAIFHYNLVRIHPFADGNGRVARIITSMVLLNYGIPPPGIQYSERFDYLTCLRYADNGDIMPLLIFLGDKVIDSLQFVLSSKNNPNE